MRQASSSGGQYYPQGQYHPREQYPAHDYPAGQYQAEELWDAESAPESDDQDSHVRGSGKGMSIGSIGLIVFGIAGLVLACVGGFYIFGSSSEPDTTTAMPAWGLMATAPVLNVTTTKLPVAVQVTPPPQPTPPPSESIFDKKTDTLDPGANLYDGNACFDDEELLLGLCYKKCSLLTNGTHPFRSTGLSCCSSEPCGFTNQKVSIGMCSGFSVSGDHMSQGGCPHKPGACLADEELSVGTCYKKCSILTNNTYPYRASGVTCCKEQGSHCLYPQNMLTGMTKTRFDYNVGGGKGDGVKATPDESHLPMSSLTEAK